ASFAFGIALVTVSLIQDERSILARAADTQKGESVLSGTIEDVRIGTYGYFRLRCDSLVAKGNMYAAGDETARVFLYVGDGTQPIPLERGMTVSVFGDLSSLGAQRNPYAFDYGRYLRTNEGIEAILYCDSYHDIV